MTYAIAFDHNLIRRIQELQECTIDELKASFLSQQPVMLEQNINELEELDAIEIKDGKIKYLKWPTPPRMLV